MTDNIWLRLFGPVPWYWFKIQNKKICSADVRSNKHEENAKKSKKCALIKIMEAQAGAFRFLSYRGQKLKTNAFHQ